MNNNPKELGTENVRKLLISYSGPAIAAMMASALYNVIDRAFIGQGVSALAIAGLAITMPVMNLSAAFGAMIGAGGATLTSIKLGQQDIGSAQKVLGNVFLLNVVLGIIFMFLGLLFLRLRSADGDGGTDREHLPALSASGTDLQYLPRPSLHG